MKNIDNEVHDPVRHPAHYEIFPIQPITISRHVGFCLGNALKYVMRAPWKGGEEDCEKALQYLKFEQETPQRHIDEDSRREVDAQCFRLVMYLLEQDGGNLWRDIAEAQRSFVCAFGSYLLNIGEPQTFSPRHMKDMVEAVEKLKHVLANRHKDSRYFGETGLPDTREVE